MAEGSPLDRVILHIRLATTNGIDVITHSGNSKAPSLYLHGSYLHPRWAVLCCVTPAMQQRMSYALSLAPDKH